MKNLRVIKGIFGLGSVLVLALGLGSWAFAGPGPQFWQQQEKIRAENAAKSNAATTATPAATPAMACPTCKTRIYEEPAVPNPADKTRPRPAKIGTRHYCDNCKGFITSLPGQVTDQMQRSHAECTTAACCTTKT